MSCSIPQDQRLLELKSPALPGQDLHMLNDIMRTAIGYVHEATATMEIYQAGLNKLSMGEPEDDVGKWLESIGFPLQHNKLGNAIIKAIGNLSQNIMQVIQNFINTVSQQLQALRA
jgi:hypothetical protein